MTIKIILIDESAIFRLGVIKSLDPHQMQIVGEAADAVSARRLIRDMTQQPANVALLNADLPNMTGIQVCDFINQYAPRIRVLLFFDPNQLENLARLFSTGARGFITKNSIYPIQEAIQAVYQGMTYLQPDIGVQFARFRDKNPIMTIYRLTDREYQVLMLLARGKLSEEISEIAHISVRTVVNLKSSGFRKLGIAHPDQLRDIFLK